MHTEFLHTLTRKISFKYYFKHIDSNLKYAKFWNTICN